jgi:hypothetical protein
VGDATYHVQWALQQAAYTLHKGGKADDWSRTSTLLLLTGGGHSSSNLHSFWVGYVASILVVHCDAVQLMTTSILVVHVTNPDTRREWWRPSLPDAGAGLSGMGEVGYVSPIPPGESGVNQAQLAAFVDSIVGARGGDHAEVFASGAGQLHGVRWRGEDVQLFHLVNP